MSLHRLLLLAFSVTPLLLAGAIWNLSIDGSSTSIPDNVQQGNLPESLLGELVFNQFDEAGNLIQQLTTARAIGYLDGDQIELVEPALQVTAINQTQWTASSERGFLDRPGSQLELHGRVELQRLGDSPAQLRTERLYWLPASASAYSDDLVTVDTPSSHMESKGISIDLDRSSFMFHSQVRGTHEPL